MNFGYLMTPWFCLARYVTIQYNHLFLSWLNGSLNTVFSQYHTTFYRPAIFPFAIKRDHITRIEILDHEIFTKSKENHDQT